MTKDKIMEILVTASIPTEEEEQELVESIKAYDWMCEEEHKKIIHIDGMKEFKDGMIEDYKDDLKFYQDDITLMTRIRETAEGETLRLCTFFIGESLLKIMEAKREIKRIQNEY